jgi:hypothetical protein
VFVNIFVHLFAQDLPEYFEDHMGEWMEGFAKLLEYKNPALVDDSEELNPGKIVFLATNVAVPPSSHAQPISLSNYL